MKNKKRTKIEETLEEDIGEVDMNDMTDSEDEYTEHQKKLLQKARTKQVPENFDSDDEVYGFESGEEEGNVDENEDRDSDDEEGDSMESDIEGLQEDYDLPNERAWGKKKRNFYSTDYVDPDYASANQKDMVNAEMEEQEARNIQKRLAQQLDDADFGITFLEGKEESKEAQDDIERVKVDLSKMSTREKRELFHKESPEFTPLITDYKDLLTQCRDILAPFLELVKTKKYPDCPAAKFLRMKYEVALHYCTNISFYLMLKAKRIPVRPHPVMKRLAQYRQLLNKLESKQGNLLKEVEEVLKAAKEDELPSLLENSKESKSQSKKSKPLLAAPSKSKKRPEEDIEMEDSDEESVEDEETDVDMAEIEDKKEEKAESVPALEATEQDEKRAITYQIAKNKGLTPHRKKEQRNPRVKHRNKYRKAKIRRKGAVREVRKEVTRYGGEFSGIKASVKKSIKLK